MKEHGRGFTLVEILVVTTIVSILAGIGIFSVNDAREVGRDAEREAKLRAMQAAVENYRRDNGRYPAGCNGTNWSGEPGTDYACGTATEEYVTGLAPDYIAALPRDPRLNGTDSGFAYLTNTDGTAYKIIVARTVEQNQVVLNFTQAALANLDELAVCGYTNVSTRPCNFVPSGPSGTAGNTPAGCTNTANVASSYAMSGGFAEGDTDREVEYYTEIVTCATPW
ncbi:MAG: prepilin-type N-terminal cleavage/methylation domain-containing protein [Patescibacteria group bacterium]